MKWVKGTKSGAFIPVFQAGSVAFSPIRVTTGYVGARVEVLFGDRQPPPFADEAGRNDLVARLSRIPGVALPLNPPSAYPSFPLAELPEQSVEQLTGVLEWAVGEVTRSRDGMMESAME